MRAERNLWRLIPSKTAAVQDIPHPSGKPVRLLTPGPTELRTLNLLVRRCKAPCHPIIIFLGIFRRRANPKTGGLGIQLKALIMSVTMPWRAMPARLANSMQAWVLYQTQAADRPGRQPFWRGSQNGNKWRKHCLARMPLQIR